MAGIVPSLDLTSIVAVVALVLAVLSLWFTHLRGAAIRHLEIDSARVADRYVNPRYPLRDSFKAEPLALTFVNEGNRAGVVSTATAAFSPQEVLKPFFGTATTEFTSRQLADESRAIPLVIPDRHVAVVYLNLEIPLSPRVRKHGWAEHDKFKEGPIEDLFSLLKEISESQRQNAKTLLDQLQKRNILGSLNVSYEVSSRRFLFFGRQVSRRIGPIPVENALSRELEVLELALEEWLSVYPTILDIIGRVNQELRNLRSFLDGLERHREEIFAGTHSPEDFTDRLVKLRTNLEWSVLERMDPRLAEAAEELTPSTYVVRQLVDSEVADDEPFREKVNTMYERAGKLAAVVSSLQRAVDHANKKAAADGPS